MSAEVLRKAAALMRERAEAATESPWEATAHSSGYPYRGGGVHTLHPDYEPQDTRDEIADTLEREDAEHAEHDSTQIWSAVCAAVRTALNAADVRAERIEGFEKIAWRSFQHPEVVQGPAAA